MRSKPGTASSKSLTTGNADVPGEVVEWQKNVYTIMFLIRMIIH